MRRDAPPRAIYDLRPDQPRYRAIGQAPKELKEPAQPISLRARLSGQSETVASTELNIGDTIVAICYLLEKTEETAQNGNDRTKVGRLVASTKLCCRPQTLPVHQEMRTQKRRRGLEQEGNASWIPLDTAPRRLRIGLGFPRAYRIKPSGINNCLERLVPKKGLEPPHPCEYMDLNHARLPIPPLRHDRIQRERLD